MATETNDPRVLVLQEMRKQTALMASVDASLKQLVVVFASVASEGLARWSASTTVPDRLCDGPHGDPLIKTKDPRDWSGDPMTGRRFSECPAEYLDLLAERFDYFASKEEDAKKQKYNLLDANRARAWAARKRNGWTPAVAPELAKEGEPRW